MSFNRCDYFLISSIMSSTTCQKYEWKIATAFPNILQHATYMHQWNSKFSISLHCNCNYINFISLIYTEFYINVSEYILLIQLWLIMQNKVICYCFLWNSTTFIQLNINNWCDLYTQLSCMSINQIVQKTAYFLWKYMKRLKYTWTTSR